MRPTLFLAALFLSVPAYADDPMPDVFAVLPSTTAKSDTLILDVFSCGEGTAGPLLSFDVFSAGVASRPAEVPSPAVPVAPKPAPKIAQQIAPQTIQYAAPTCRYVWTRFGWMQTCQ
jgi:hypothetical protein